MNDKICVVGWHYFSDFYKKLSQSKSNIHVVAHRYNKILDKKHVNYSVIKNIGLEFGAYDWFIKNVWDGKSNVLFMHDDIIMSKKYDFKDIFSSCKGLDFVSFRNNKKLAGGGRCMYMSGKMICLFINKFGGIWFDKEDRGYTYGKKVFYDDIYADKDYFKNKDRIGVKFKLTLRYLIEKYHLKRKNIFDNKITLCVRGENKTDMNEHSGKNLNDNSIFGIDENSFISSLDKKDYFKWYDFFFSKIKKENLDIIELGISKNNLKLWKNYFTNSHIRGLENARINSFKETCKNINFGFDIVIDNGNHSENRATLFEELFKKMNPGGIYVLEKLRHNNNLINYLKEKVDIINFNGKYHSLNYEEIVHKHNKKLDFFEKRISSIYFCLDMCFIFKRYCK